MLRSAASKVMWVGRATVFLVGLAVILALVFGAVSTVSAHTGDRGFFHLGHRNVSGAISKLVGKVAGPSLFIGNGSEDRRATALRLNVKPGKAPMKVNSDAKVPKLNSDKLDGKHASAFASAAELAEAKDDAWAYVIASTGGLHASSGNISVTHPATGKYCVVVPKRFSHKAAQVTLADPDGTKIVSVGTGHGSSCNPLFTPTHDVVPVYVNTPTGTDVDGNFTIVVPAPQ